MANGRQFGQPAVYQIRVSGALDQEWSEWFEGFDIIPVGDNQTMISGTVQDQASLYGLLVKIRDLGLPLLALERTAISPG